MTCDGDGVALLFRRGVQLPSLAHFFGTSEEQPHGPTAGMPGTDGGVDGSSGSSNGLVFQTTSVKCPRTLSPVRWAPLLPGVIC
ncbi:hypothetical protein MHYP_G00143570 [Metynnis hypsauchen]